MKTLQITAAVAGAKEMGFNTYIFFWAYLFYLGRGLMLGLLTMTRTHGRILCARDRSVTETSTWQHSQQRGIRAAGGIRNRNPSNRAAVDPSARSGGHRDWQYVKYVTRRHTNVTRNSQQNIEGWYSSANSNRDKDSATMFQPAAPNSLQSPSAQLQVCAA